MQQQQQQQQQQQPNRYGYAQPTYAGAAPKTNPYARTNPYAPSNNIYKPASPVATPSSLSGTTSGVPPPPPKASYKHETEGWNDLPDTFKAKTAAPRRAAAAATPPVSTPTPVSAPAFGSPDNHHLLQVNQEVLDQFHLLVILRKHSQQRMFFHLRLKVSVVLPREQRFQLLQPFQLHQNPLLSRISIHLQLPRMLCNLHHQDLRLQH